MTNFQNSRDLQDSHDSHDSQDSDDSHESHDSQPVADSQINLSRAQREVTITYIYKESIQRIVNSIHGF